MRMAETKIYSVRCIAQQLCAMTQCRYIQGNALIHEYHIKRVPHKDGICKALNVTVPMHAIPRHCLVS